MMETKTPQETDDPEMRKMLALMERYNRMLWRRFIDIMTGLAVGVAIGATGTMLIFFFTRLGLFMSMR